mmetsp:Transcript_6308/g.9564  ORF Transcript_6308/g.9564 Transcript_6308/m.9564 type:complete len:345 (-) Transcript_6308:804-1838(-)
MCLLLLTLRLLELPRCPRLITWTCTFSALTRLVVRSTLLSSKTSNLSKTPMVDLTISLSLINSSTFSTSIGMVMPSATRTLKFSSDNVLEEMNSPPVSKLTSVTVFLPPQPTLSSSTLVLRSPFCWKTELNLVLTPPLLLNLWAPSMLLTTRILTGLNTTESPWLRVMGTAPKSSTLPLVASSSPSLSIMLEKRPSETLPRMKRTLVLSSTLSILETAPTLTPRCGLDNVSRVSTSTSVPSSIWSTLSQLRASLSKVTSTTTSVSSTSEPSPSRCPLNVLSRTTLLLVPGPLSTNFATMETTMFPDDKFLVLVCLLLTSLSLVSPRKATSTPKTPFKTVTFLNS